MLDPEQKRIDQQWIDAIAVPLVILDAAGAVLAMNAAACEYLAISAEQVAGKPVQATPLMPDLGDRLNQTEAFPIHHTQGYETPAGAVRLKWVIHPIYAEPQTLTHYTATGELLPPQTAPVQAATYQEIVQKSNNGIYIMDRDGQIIEWNTALELITGVSQAAALGKTVWDILHQLTPAQQQTDALYDLLKQETLAVFEKNFVQTAIPNDLTIIREDGQPRTLMRSGFVLDSSGSTLGVGIVRDITRHRQMEDELRASERRYELLVSNLPNVGVMLYDHDLRFSVVAGRALSGLNIEPEKVRGSTLYDISSGTELTQGLRFYQSALEGKTQQFEYEHVNRSYELQILPVHDGDQISGGMVLVIDITQRKAAEWALRNSEERYRLLIDSMQEGVLIFSENGAITYVNDKTVAITGYSREELVGENVVRLMAREARELVMEEMRQLQSGQSRIFEQPFMRRDGTTGYVIVAASPMLDDKQYFRGGFVIITDITERKAMEDALRQSNDELDAFAHTVAHDLKNPLSTAQGFANLLQDIKHELKADELEEYLAHIQQSNDRMMNIIDELLLLAEMRHTEVKMVHVDMPPLVESALQRLDYMITFQQPIIETGDMSAWSAAVGYPAWIEEVWTNYISNAIKYGGKPAQIQLGADLIQDGELVKFWVQDNGSGVPEDKRGQLFIAFKRFDRVRAEGHGLGLSIVKRIVNLLGGDVGYEYIDGVGSRFSFTLPTRLPEPETEDAAD